MGTHSPSSQGHDSEHSSGRSSRLAYLGAFITEPPGTYDEGLIVCGAARILRHQLPYRDFNTGYPPAGFYNDRLVPSLFLAPPSLAERIWDTLWRLAIVGLAVVPARAATPLQQAHPFPLFCALLITGICGAHLYPLISCMLPCFAAVWFAVLYLNQRGLRWLFFSGICLGWFRGLVQARSRRLRLRCGDHRDLLSGDGRREAEMASVAGCLLDRRAAGYDDSNSVFLVIGANNDLLVQSFIDFPRNNFAGRYVPVPGPSAILAWSEFYLPMAVIVAAAITLRRAAADRKPILTLLLMCSVFTVALATQRLDIQHAYPAIMFSLVLLCACIADWQLENRRLLQNLFLSGVVLCCGLVPLFVFARRMTRRTEEVPPGIAPAELRYSRNEPPNEIVRAGPILLALDERQAVEYIQGHLLPGGPLYVGAATHSLVSYNDALFYFLADRPQVTRFDMFVPGITTSAAVQSEMLRDIRQKQTEYVVLFRAPPSHEPNLSSVDSGVSILDDAIRQEYIQVAEFGRYTIWHHKNP